MPGTSAPKNGAKAAPKLAKKAATKSVVKKVATKKAAPAKKAPAKKAAEKKAAGRKLFPTKAELEALKLAKAKEAQTAAEKKAAGRKLFPTKAELEAKRLAAEAAKNPKGAAATAAVATKGGKPIVTKIDGEEVELEEVELEDLERLVEEVTEIVATEEKENEIRVVNVAEESQNEENAFTIKDSEEDDAPVQTVLTAGATADPVKDYLKLIGRVPLLNAEMEVELSLQVEAGLFAEEKIFLDKKLDKKQAVAKFIPHDPYEYGPVMIYAFKDRRPPHRIGIRAHIQVGTYGKHGEQLLTSYKIPTNNMREVTMTPANATMVAHAIMKNTAGALTEAAGAGYIPKNKKEADDPRYSMAMTQDIKPGEDKRQAAKWGFNISNNGPPKLNTNGKA